MIDFGLFKGFHRSVGELLLSMIVIGVETVSLGRPGLGRGEEAGLLLVFLSSSACMNSL